MKTFCSSLVEHATNVINLEKKKMLLLTKKELKSHQDETKCYICGKRFSKKFAKGKNYQKFRDHCHFTGKRRGATYTICNLRFTVPNKNSCSFPQRVKLWIPLCNKRISEGQFEDLEENTEKYKTFSKIDKDGDESVVTISYKIKFIDSARFIASSLSNLDDNLAEGINKIKR